MVSLRVAGGLVRRRKIRLKRPRNTMYTIYITNDIIANILHNIEGIILNNTLFDQLNAAR